MSLDKNILITGAKGQLGQELCKLLPNAIATDLNELDITKEVAIEQFVQQHNIELIINCAAYTAVDNAEDASEQILCQKLNEFAPEFLAKTGCQLIHISTDYVFDGHGYRAYTESDETNPLNVYGKTKRDGEVRVLLNNPAAIVVRTSWLYSAHGNNFVKTMVKLGSSRDQCNVISDQIGSPTFAGDLASAVVAIVRQLQEYRIQNNKQRITEHEWGGIYHYSNEGVCSWYDFAYEIMHMKGLTCQVNAIPSEQYPTKAQRPFFSVLDKTKIKQNFNITIPHWKESLYKCLQTF